MRPDEIEGLTGEFKPNLIHEIRCSIGLERPGGYRKMLQQPGLELQFFVGFGKLPCSFRDPPFDFICNPLLLISTQCSLEPNRDLVCACSKLQAQVLGIEATVQSLAPAFIALTVEGI